MHADRKPLPQIWTCMHMMERKRGTEEEGSEQVYKKAKRDDSDSEYADKTKAKCLLLRHLGTYTSTIDYYAIKYFNMKFMRETGMHFKRWECEGRST